MPQGPQQFNGEMVLVALGSNATSDLGDPRETLMAAATVLREIWGDVAFSAFYQTPAFPAGSGPDFVNAACAFTTDMSPQDILDHLHKVEAYFGRKRDIRWGQRTLDLDLIAVGDTVLPDAKTYNHWRNLPLEAQKTTAPDTLILPHPRLQDRPFVLVPLADVAPDWTHPILAQTVSQLSVAHSDAARAEIRAIR